MKKITVSTLVSLLIFQFSTHTIHTLISLIYLESEPVKQMSTAKALARLLELNLTQDSYLKLRKDAIDAGADIWPPYTQVQALKKLCLPRDILYKDDEVVVTLQVGSII